LPIGVGELGDLEIAGGAKTIREEMQRIEAPSLQRNARGAERELRRALAATPVRSNVMIANLSSAGTSADTTVRELRDSPAGQAADPHRDLLRITGEQPIYLAGRELGFRLAAPEPTTPPVMRSFFRHASRALPRGAQS
jgi:hypothetical protein